MFLIDLLKNIKKKRWGIKSSRMNFYYRLLVAILICVFFTKNAYAYLDAGTGSYIVQVLIGVLMGVIITIKFYWRSIVDFFKNHFKPRK